MKYRLIRTFFIRNPQPLISASKICHKMGFFGQFWTKIPLFGVETLCTYTLDYSLKKNLASVVPNPFSFFYLKFRQWRTKHCRLFRLGSLKFPSQKSRYNFRYGTPGSLNFLHPQLMAPAIRLPSSNFFYLLIRTCFYKKLLPFNFQRFFDFGLA